LHFNQHSYLLVLFKNANERLLLQRLTYNKAISGFFDARMNDTANRLNATTHLIIIPSYNTGAILETMLREVLQYYAPIWVVVDGSTDNSRLLLNALVTEYSHSLKVIDLPKNSGKGAAVFTALQQARTDGFTHALIMDADHQHPAAAIANFMQLSTQNPEAMILGKPVFAASAPALRVQGRKISNAWANLETLNWGIGDSLFGMRLYPIADLIAVLESTRWARRFDFEPEVAVRLAWRGVAAINLDTPVRYLRAEEGGVSQFRYLRDNTLLTWMHLRLFLEFLLRLPHLLIRKFK
jgi:glycosyltransferase involved in cell wall biosynthesis